MSALWVALGGALGSVCRYGATALLSGTSAAVGLPLGTLAVNVLGSLLLGAIVERASQDPHPSAAWIAFLATGFCGGFTTMSTFSVETLRLPWPQAAANVALNLATCLAAAWVGAWLVRALPSAGEAG